MRSRRRRRVVDVRSSAYGTVRVEQDDAARYLLLNRSRQGSVSLLSGQPDLTRARMPYVRALELVDLYLEREPTHICVVGLGTGVTTMRLRLRHPRSAITAIELNPVVVDVARRWFGCTLADDELVVGDARDVLAATADAYDLVVVDAFVPVGTRAALPAVPSHLTTREFVEVVDARLAPGGIVAFYIPGAVEGPGSRFLRSVHRTYALRFEHLALHPTKPELDLPQDTVLIASHAPLVTREEAIARAAVVAALADREPELERFARLRYEGEIDTSGVLELVDADPEPVTSVLENVPLQELLHLMLRRLSRRLRSSI